jgi:hypothetical protein
VSPDIAVLYPFGPWGFHKFFGLNILVMMRYSGTVLPSIFAVYDASMLYQYFRKTIPSAVKNFLAPFFTLIITVPLMFLVIGPVFGVVGMVLSNAVGAIVELRFIVPILLGLIVGGIRREHHRYLWHYRADHLRLYAAQEKTVSYRLSLRGGIGRTGGLRGQFPCV